MYQTKVLYCLLLSSLSLPGRCLEDTLLPSGTFRDDLLFDLTWPGPPDQDSTLGETREAEYDPQLSSELEGGNVPENVDGIDEYVGKSGFAGEEGRLEVSEVLLPEVDYEGLDYIDMRTGRGGEEYRCVLPQILRWDSNENDDSADDEENRAENLLKSLNTRCTKLILGYWIYELCHGSHVRQYHEPLKQTSTPITKEKLDEYFLGMVTKSEKKESKDDAHSIASSSQTAEGEADTSVVKHKPEDIPVWYFNGNEYPYYKVEMGDGTPCDLKGDQPRSIIIRYICDMNAHVTGTFLHVEEVTTCKYEAVVATTNLCQSKAYRLKENPVHPVKCFSKDGSPRKPNSLLEHEISMMQHLKNKKPSKPSKSGGSGDAGGYRSNIGVDKDKGAHLDDTFIQSFLSGDICLRGGSGWWQHEVCYGKYVKQVHEEVGKQPDELYLGNWMEEGHRRWFTNAGYKRQSKNHVIHLYLNGDVCDVTGVARQCQVKFRCSKSARASQISLFLEEPTTCNYILTVEAPFLCPLLQDTTEDGLFALPESASKGVGLGEESGRGQGEEDLEYDDDGNVKKGSVRSGNVDSEWDQDVEREWDQDNQEEDDEVQSEQDL